MSVIYPGARTRILGTQTQPKMKTHDIICLHTMVGYLVSTDTMFKLNGFGGLESHFGVGGKWGPDSARKLDGVVYQWQDTTYSADANLDGNHRVISIETADNAPQSASDIEPWTPKQLDAIVDLVAWLCKTYDIPPVLIPDTKPGRRGIGYHRQGCRHSMGLGVPGFLVAGGEKWSASVGKVCPGQARISQLVNDVIPRVKAKLNPPKVADVALTKSDAELIVKTFFEYQQKLSAMDAQEMSSAGTARHEGEKLSTGFLFKWGGPGVYRLLRVLTALQKDVSALKVQVAALASKEEQK